MGTRIKTKALASREEFTVAIDEIAMCQTKLRAIEARRDARIQAVQDEFGPQIEPLQLTIDAKLALTEAYALAHRDEVIPPGRQSGETQLAAYGFRQHPAALKPLNRKWTWESILEALKRRYGARFVRVEEAPAKDEIKSALGDGELADVGLRLEVRESFGVTPKVDGGEPETAAARVAA